MSTTTMPPLLQARAALDSISQDVTAALATDDIAQMRALLLNVHLHCTIALEVLPEVFAGRDGT